MSRGSQRERAAECPRPPHPPRGGWGRPALLGEGGEEGGEGHRGCARDDTASERGGAVEMTKGREGEERRERVMRKQVICLCVV